MKLADIPIGKKLIGGFLVVVGLLSAVGFYELASMSRLSNLQDDGAKRSLDAQKIKDIAFRLESVYSVVADSIINRDMEETKKEVPRLKATMQQDIVDHSMLDDDD